MQTYVFLCFGDMAMLPCSMLAFSYTCGRGNPIGSCHEASVQHYVCCTSLRQTLQNLCQQLAEFFMTDLFPTL